MYNRCRKKKAQQYKIEIIHKLDNLKEQNPDEYWKLLKKLKSEDCNNNNLISSEEWEIYFKNLNKDRYSVRNQSMYEKIKKLEELVIFNETDFKITDHEIMKAIKRLKGKKSPGIDCILPEMIKYSQHVMLPVLTKIFNHILQTGNYPKQWLRGYIIPIYKKGTKTDPSNYRGITIGSCLGKLFNMILNERLITYFDKHNVISKCQIGFKKKHRTSDHIFVLNSLINKYTSQGKRLYTCFVDMQKAFDMINRVKLMYKLKQTGIGSLLYSVIKDMYLSSKAEIAVKVENTLTEMFKSEIGVYQGDVLSPSLFNLYINDLVNQFDSECMPACLDNTDINCLLYADDVVLISTSEEGLQKSVDKLSEYCNYWDLKINIDKTKVVVFNKHAPVRNIQICHDGHVIESCESYRYLGMLLSSNGNLSVSMADLSRRGLKAIFKMKSMFKKSDVSFNTMIHLFDHIIKPIMLYGSDIWGHMYINEGKLQLKQLYKDDIELNHIRFLRFLLGVSRKAPNVGIYGETGRFPMAIDALIHTVKYWYRLSEFDENSIVRKAFNDMQKIDIRNGWFKIVDDLVKTNRLHVNESPKLVIQHIKRSLQSQFKSIWKEKLYDDSQSVHGNKLRSYRTYKTDFKKEEYLGIKSISMRGAFSRLRLSAHNLHIETGRYVSKKERKPPEKRICQYCKEDVCENEYHFIMNCTNYDCYRNELFQQIIQRHHLFANYNNNEKFLWLMSNVDMEIIPIILKYINICFSKRKTSIPCNVNT